jgi:hypothetical protein
MEAKRAQKRTRSQAKRPDGETVFEHLGHRVMIPLDGPGRRVLIDDVPYRYGQAGGTYYLDAYAYDPADTLEELVRRYVDARDGRAGRDAKGAPS